MLRLIESLDCAKPQWKEDDSLFDRKRILGLFWPVLAEQAVATFIGLLATLFVRSVSEAAMAGVGMLGTLNFLVMNAFTAIATGVTVIVSQNIGRGDHKTAGEAAAQSLVIVTYISIALGAIMVIFRGPILAFLFGSAEAEVLESADIYLFYSSVTLPLQAIFSTIAGIMRSTGNTRVPMLGSVVSNAAYIAAAAPLIYLMKLGVTGAGIALGVSRLAPAVFLALYLYKGKGGVYLPHITPKLSMRILSPVLRIAIPAGVDSIIFNGGKLLVQVFMSGMGTAVLSANSISNNLASFINLPGGAMQIIAVTIVGQTFGAGKFAECRKRTFQITGVTMLLQLAVTVVCLPTLPYLINLFDPSAGAFAESRRVMLLALIATPLFWPLSFVTPNCLRATGDAAYTMWVSVLSMIIVRVTGAWLLGVYFGLNLFGIWIAMVGDWVARGAFFLVRTQSIRKRLEKSGTKDCPT